MSETNCALGDFVEDSVRLLQHRFFYELFKHISIRTLSDLGCVIQKKVSFVEQHSVRFLEILCIDIRFSAIQKKQYHQESRVTLGPEPGSDLQSQTRNAPETRTGVQREHKI